MEQQELAWEVHFRLLEAYGEREYRPDGSPVDELIGTILSANTNDTNSGRAFRQLKERFGEDWEAVRTAPLAELKDAIRCAGMYNQKAPRIVETLTAIQRDQGAYTLDHLADLPVDQALAYLTALPGVGHKTASIVLLFSFGKAAFPVDTHIQRISQRVGICQRTATPEAIKAIWEKRLPGKSYLSLHLNLITHGREVCRARKPACGRCALQPVCAFAAGTGDWAAAS